MTAYKSYYCAVCRFVDGTPRRRGLPGLSRFLYTASLGVSPIKLHKHSDAILSTFPKNCAFYVFCLQNRSISGSLSLDRALTDFTI